MQALDGVGKEHEEFRLRLQKDKDVELAGIADYAQAALGRQVRIGRPRVLSQLSAGGPTAALATLAGLAAFAASDPNDLWTLADAQARRARADDGRSPILRLVQSLRASF